jgi:hypothetical protein
MASEDSADAHARRAVDAALAMLREDPGSDTLRRFAAKVQEIDRERRTGNLAEVRARIDSLLGEVAAVLEFRLPAAPDDKGRVEANALAGALRDAARAGGRRP